MTSARWATLCAIVLVSVAPFGVLASCGSTSSSGGDHGGDDATADGAGTFDGTRGDSPGDGGMGEQAPASEAGGCSDTCPPGIQCGHYTTCSGATIACGAPCAKGQVCLSNQGNPP